MEICEVHIGFDDPLTKSLVIKATCWCEQIIDTKKRGDIPKGLLSHPVSTLLHHSCRVRSTVFIITPSTFSILRESINKGEKVANLLEADMFWKGKSTVTLQSLAGVKCKGGEALLLIEVVV